MNKAQQNRVDSLAYDLNILASGAELEAIPFITKAKLLLLNGEFNESFNELMKAYQGDDSWSERCVDMAYDIKNLVNYI